MRQATVPAVPSTPAQHGRYERVLRAAVAVLTAGGEEALQMKDLAQRAEVSLATLYRYFPSKDHVLLAVSAHRYEQALRRVADEGPHGATVRERVTNHLLREFRAEQRDQKLTTALVRVLTETRRDFSDVMEQVEHLHLRILRQVAGAGGPISEQQHRMLPIVMGAFASATRRWLAGVSSAADARFAIRTCCRLLDLPDAVVDEDRERADGAYAGR